MEKILNCIDDYLNDLQKEMMAIVEDQSIPLTRKNQLMEPIADQKKILVYAKEALIGVQNREYQAGCGMMRYRSEDGS